MVRSSQLFIVAQSSVAQVLSSPTTHLSRNSDIQTSESSGWIKSLRLPWHFLCTIITNRLFSIEREKKKKKVQVKEELHKGKKKIIVEKLGINHQQPPNSILSSLSRLSHSLNLDFTHKSYFCCGNLSLAAAFLKIVVFLVVHSLLIWYFESLIWFRFLCSLFVSFSSCQQQLQP